METDKILILGAKGMLGRELAAAFGGKAAAWDREECDITRPEDLKFKAQKLKPKIIINCAAFTNVDACEENPDLAKALNSDAVLNLAEIVNETGAVLVHFSTSYVFDGENEKGYFEEDVPQNPKSIYGKTKLLGEQNAKMAKKYYILRLDRLFGESGSGKLSFVEKISKIGQERESQNSLEKIKVVNNEVGSPSFAPDVAVLTKYILENSLPYGVYHAANSGFCSWYQWAREIFKIQGFKLELLEKVESSEFRQKAQRPKFSILNNSKLPQGLYRSWEEALKTYLKIER
jgi:dTDP-4-dehydrorhamnose reductase